MSLKLKAICLSFVFFALVSHTDAQINLLSNNITFRQYENPMNFTYHYGDLQILGGSSGEFWGWLWCNQLRCNSDAIFWGNLSVAGNKNFIHPHPTDSNKVIKYICVESGEALTIARGLAKTTGGSVSIAIPEHFSLVTSNDAPLTLLLTPENAPVLLYSTKKTKEQITVAMKPSDFKEFGDVTFSWQLSGVRDGYENGKVILDLETLANTDNSITSTSESRKKLSENTKRMAEKITKISEENKKANLKSK